MNIVEKMKLDWDRRARHDARYWIATEDYRTEEEFQRSGEASARAILELSGAEDEELLRYRVLEIGCGIGRILRPLAPRVREAVGVDVSSEMIEKSALWLEDADNVRTVEGSGVDLFGLDDESFDLVYSYVAFQHMPRDVFRHYLGECHRVLRADGALVFQVYLGERAEPSRDDTIALRVYRASDLRDYLEAAGFRAEEQRLEHPERDGIESWLVRARRCPGERSYQAPDSFSTACGDAVSPMDSHLYRNLARNQLAEGERAAAIETMRQHLALDPTELGVALELTSVLVEDGRVDEAIGVLHDVNRHHPGYEEAYLSLAQLLALGGARDEAIDVIDRLHARFPDRSALHERARSILASALAARAG